MNLEGGRPTGSDHIHVLEKWRNPDSDSDSCLFNDSYTLNNSEELLGLSV